jgi:hypothetical protein
MTGVRRVLRDNGLGLVFGGLFLAMLVGQSFAGEAQVNAERLTEGLPPVSWADFVSSSTFAVDVMENWQSEYLQFFLYVFATVWLVQRGSPESKEVDEVGTESDEDQLIGRHARPDSPRWAAVGGWRTAVFSRSLGLLMLGIFLATWVASSITGWASFNSEQLTSRQDPVSWPGYLTEADFWNRSLQNWQSEMLAVGSMAVFAVYLRQRGSPESKPVGAAQVGDTGKTG